MSPAGRADYENAKALFPSCASVTSAEWLKFLESETGLTVIAKMLGDAYQVVRDDEERMLGTKKPGRRPPRHASLEQVINTVFPARASMEPFPEALAKLMRGRSRRGFLVASDVAEATLRHLLSGKRQLTMPILERLAEAARVSPGFFLEYRAMYVGELVTLLLLERPQMSQTVMRDLLKLRRTGTR